MEDLFQQLDLLRDLLQSTSTEIIDNEQDILKKDFNNSIQNLCSDDAIQSKQQVVELLVPKLTEKLQQLIRLSKEWMIKRDDLASPLVSLCCLKDPQPKDVLVADDDMFGLWWRKSQPFLYSFYVEMDSLDQKSDFKLGSRVIVSNDRLSCWMNGRIVEMDREKCKIELNPQLVKHFSLESPFQWVCKTMIRKEPMDKQPMMHWGEKLRLEFLIPIQQFISNSPFSIQHLISNCFKPAQDIWTMYLRARINTPDDIAIVLTECSRYTSLFHHSLLIVMLDELEKLSDSIPTWKELNTVETLLLAWKNSRQDLLETSMIVKCENALQSLASVVVAEIKSNLVYESIVYFFPSIDQQDWESPKPFYSNTRCTYGVQSWIFRLNYFYHMTLSQRTLLETLVETFDLVSAKYLILEPSRCRIVQYKIDILYMVTGVFYLLNQLNVANHHSILISKILTISFALLSNMCLLSLPFSQIKRFLREQPSETISFESLREIVSQYVEKKNDDDASVFNPLAQYSVIALDFKSFGAVDVKVKEILSRCPFSKDQMRKILSRRHELGNWEYPLLSEEEEASIHEIQQAIKDDCRAMGDDTKTED